GLLLVVACENAPCGARRTRTRACDMHSLTSEPTHRRRPVVLLCTRAAIQDHKPLPEIVRRLLHVSYLPLSLRAVLVHEQADHVGLWNKIAQQPQPFCSEQRGKKGGARHIGAGPIEIRN